MNILPIRIFVPIFAFCCQVYSQDLMRVFDERSAELDRLVSAMAADNVDFVSAEKAVGRSGRALSSERQAYYRDLLNILRLESFGNVKGPPYYGAVTWVNSDEGGIQLGFAYGNVPEGQVVRAFNETGDVNVPLFVSLRGHWYIYLLRYRGFVSSRSEGFEGTGLIGSGRGNGSRTRFDPGR